MLQVVVLYVEQEESVRRQMGRAQQVCSPACSEALQILMSS